MKYLVIVLALILAVPSLAQDTPLKVVATTTIIADIAQNVGGDLVEVTALIPPDSDIHAFQPVPQDVALVAGADVLLVNGAGLEGFLGGLVENAAGVVPVVISNGVSVLPFGGHHDDDHDDDHAEAEFIGVLGVDAECDLEAHDEDHEAEEHEGEEHAEDEHGEHGECDPHFWTNPQNVIVWAGNIAEAFAAADPANADIYRANAAQYSEQIAALDAEIESILAAVPDEQRVLVTNHEFLAYFAERYGFEIVGTVIPGGSTLAEPSPQEVAALIAVLEGEGVRAIFAEVSDPGRLAAVIAGDLEGVTVVTLYSDSLSGADGPAATYIDYLRYNATAIAGALTR